MEQSGITYTLVGPDGTTVILDGSGTQTTPFRVSDVDGLESPEIRTNIEDLPEQDGAVVGDFFLGSRPIVLTGRIVCDTATERNGAIANLARASKALRSNATLKFQPTGFPALQVAVRRQQRLLVTGNWVKEFQLQLIAADPLIYSQTLNTQIGTGTTSAPGAAFPWVFPVDFGGGIGSTIAVTATNAGNETAPAVIRVYGPVTDPTITNATTGESITLDGVTLAAGEYIEIDTHARTVTHSNGADYYDRVRFPSSVWFGLIPGANTIQLWAGTSSTGVEIDVSWRDTWA